MTEITMPLWQVVTLGVTVLVAFFGFVFAVWKVVSKLQERQVQTWVSALATSAANAKEKADETEKAFLKLLADLPLNYVRREDWIRNQTIIEAKLDALAAKIDAKEARHGC